MPVPCSTTCNRVPMGGADRLRRIGGCACLAAAIALCAPVSAHADGARTSAALRTALRDPGTWIPAVAALVVALSGCDHPISDRAMDWAPVFGTKDEALDASDVLRDVSYFEMIATSPMPEGASSSVDRWSETIFAEHAGLLTASAVTWALKRTIGRERPNGMNRHSFPSGHATRAFAARGAITYNLDRSTLADPARITADVAFSLAAVGTAWARVEGGAHHASDVLAGAAIGNFFGRFFAEALGPEDDVAPHAPRAPGIPAVAVTIRF